MRIKKLVANNLNEITIDLPDDSSIGIAGLSGSGKSSFCKAIYDESMKRIISLLPKSDARFLFGDKLHSNYSAQWIENIPLVFYLGKSGFAANPRSTLGTHTGVFKDVRRIYADKFKKATEFFSFNNSIMWCEKCKGRGSTAGVVCKECKGSRYSHAIGEYTISVRGEEYSIDRLNEISIDKLLECSDEIGISTAKKQLLENLVDLNVGYLNIGRVMSTLSGGETVRVLLAEFMTECENSLIIIDEISIGLDEDTLLNVLREISRLGSNNQIWLIDHSDMVLNAAKMSIYFGPGSGKNGGNIVENSPRPAPEYIALSSIEESDSYKFTNLKKRNINISFFQIFKNKITAITGESGCGKSTLVHDCLIPYMAKKYKDVMCVTIGQDRNQSITSKSTIATFLNIKKRTAKYNEDILGRDLNEVVRIAKKDNYICQKLKMLIELGLDYLTLDRQVQTLSTGEFQCLHLTEMLTENLDKEMLFIFDEPSKGLSQNILNKLMKSMRSIVDSEKKTILIIEHNKYILRCSDFIVDFGKRSDENITSLTTQRGEVWQSKIHTLTNKAEGKLQSAIHNRSVGIQKINNDIESIYTDYENTFKGGMLKCFSSTARWIYSDLDSDIIKPVMVFDLEANLYSKNTFLYEVAGAINEIIGRSNFKHAERFDYYNRDNLCKCCKGTGEIETFNFNNVISNPCKGIWDGMVVQDIMVELKRYNYSKIKFLFKEVKKSTGCDLAKPFSEMTDTEKRIFLYGYHEEDFYDASKSTRRSWKGIIYLILKYMRSSKSEYKKTINSSKNTMICPNCSGAVLNHNIQMNIGGKDIREIVTGTITSGSEILKGIHCISDFIRILGDEVKLNTDVSMLSQNIQVELKLLEIMYASLYGYTIVLKNAAPFYDTIEKYINEISVNNQILLLDYSGIMLTKEKILDKYFSKGKGKATSYVYELFGFSNIMTEINRIRKNNPCEFCNGSKVLREESIFENVDVTETPCHSCKETGISDKGLLLLVSGITVSDWLVGSAEELVNNLPLELNNLCMTSKISDLNKYQLWSLIKYLEEKNNANI